MNRLARMIFALAAVAMLTLSPHAAEARRVWPTFGANGDAGIRVECPAGQALVGFNGRVGLWLDQIQLMCAPLLADRTFGPAYAYGDPIGGDGGAPQSAVCERTSHMTSLTIVLTATRVVRLLSFTCKDQAGNIKQASIGPFKYPGGENMLQSCPQEDFTGLDLRFGRHVGAVGAICDATWALTPHRPPAPPVAAAPAPSKPARSTGGHADGPAASYLGKWGLTTSLNGSFDLVIHEDEAQGALWGEFTNADPKYNGTLIGKLRPNARMFDFTYEQPANNSSGSGYAMIFPNNSFTASVTTNDDPPVQFSWRAVRQ